MRAWLSLALIALVPAVPAWSQTSAETETDAASAYSLPEIVVTATKTAHGVDEAPIPTQVISRDEILRTTSGNVETVLDEIPDLYVRRNEQFRLGASTVRMQGADANKVAILLNGRRFQGGVDGVVDLRDIPVQNIERIEIIRGPASSLYGSDAMAGVINIITRKGGSEPSADATIGGGNYGRLLAAASHGYRIGDLGYFLSYQHDQVELAQVYGAISSQFAGANSDAKQTRDNLFADLDYDLTSTQQASALVNYNPVREGPDSQKHNLTTGAGWNWKPAPTWDTRLSFNRYGFQRDNDLAGFEEDVDYADWSAEGAISHAAAYSLFGEQHLVTLGHRFRREGIDIASTTRGTGDGPVFETPASTHDAVHNSPYFQDEIGITDEWSAVVGFSVDLHDQFGATASPRFSLSWQPWDSLRLTGTVGRGYRAPDLLQLFDIDANNIVIVRDRISGYVILGNRNLDPETDLGATIQLETKPFAGASGFLQFFRHDFRDLIDVSLVCAGAGTCVPGFENPFPELQGQVFRYQNVGKAVTQGFDAGVRLEPLTLLGCASTIHQLRFAMSYGFLEAENKSGRPGEGDELPFRPPNRALASLEYERPDLGSRMKFWGEYEDRTFTDLTNSTEFIAESHFFWNLRAETTPAKLITGLQPPGLAGTISRDLSLFVEVTNLTDEEFGVSSPMGRIAGRRLVVAGVSYSLGAK